MARKTKKSGNFEKVYQLKISLKGMRPPIWRRVLVPENITLSDLHEVIQWTMGWYDEHLYQFEIYGHYYGEFKDYDVTDATKIRLNEVVGQEKERFSYEYDFGDSWEHKILVEKILPRAPEEQYPRCIGGKRACPPEDVGGVWGYVEFLEAIRDPEHPEHEDMLEWIGEEFDPEEFDVEEADQSLSDLRERYG